MEVSSKKWEILGKIWKAIDGKPIDTQIRIVNQYLMRARNKKDQKMYTTLFGLKLVLIKKRRKVRRWL